MANQKTLRAFGQLLTYPNQHTAEAAELLYIILMSDVPEAAKGISAFGTFIEQHDLWEVEEAFTQTFDVNPACALDIGWHLFGEEYARGMFLVRMREELRKHGLVETTELPDHITHVLAIIGEMSDDDAGKFVRACILPAMLKMRDALADTGSPYSSVVSSLTTTLHHVWGAGFVLTDGSESKHADGSSIDRGVDLLHAFPVADVHTGCGSGGCGGGGCGSHDNHEFVPLRLHDVSNSVGSAQT